MENPGNITIRDENVSEILDHDIPYKLGKYEIKNELGRGTCGIVYKGYDPFVRRDVAIKVGWTEPSATSGNESSYAQTNVFNEAYAAGKLQHPNIVSLYDAQIEKELSYIVMEFVEGKTLLEYCRRDGKRLSAKDILESMFKCCLALNFSHQAGVIHRDIKPSNIMLTKDGETKIMDFSVAEVSQSDAIKSEMIVGSPNYMSPEQVKCKAVGPTSDLYSLAAVMFQLFSGKTLYPRGSVKQIFYDIVHTPPPKLIDFRPDLPPALSEIIDKALSKNPADRYQTGKELASDLTIINDSITYNDNAIGSKESKSALLKLPFFSQFTDENLDELMTISSILKFSTNQIISKEGDIDNSYYLIASGNVRVRKQSQQILVLNPGDCFGESITSHNSSRSTTLEADTNTYILKVNSVGIDTISKETQLLFYKGFTGNLIDRLSGSRK